MYDVIIIGAGIGGLVCGCYLAKAGLKVLIAEQHNKAGGYCTSFRRNDFIFDAAPHCFGSFREGGMLRKILTDINLDNRLNIIRFDPSDTFITPDYRIRIWNDFKKTIDEFQKSFPDEGHSIKELFYLLIDTSPSAFSKLRKITFRELLNRYLTNSKLKEVIALPLLAIVGLPSSKLSAFAAAKLYSEFLFDGGYYPDGGMQKLPDALAERFKEFGGELRLSCFVKKIIIRNNMAVGIIEEKSNPIESKYVVSSCDARQTFIKLIGKENIDVGFIHKLENMKPSMSNYILYLGLDKDFNPLQNTGTAFYFFSHYNSEQASKFIRNGNYEGYGGYAFRISRDKSTIYAGMPAPYKSKTYWIKNKKSIADSFIQRIEKTSISDLTKHIIYKDAATPSTMHRYTLNYKGASYGWASIPSQMILPEFKKPLFIKNLYLAGHWTTFGVGISGAAYVGYDTAKIISRKK